MLIALLGLGVDGGSLYLHRRTMQNAADAAALAGARIMATGNRSSATIRAEIDNYATRNSVSSPATNVTSCNTDASRARIGGAFTAASGNAPANALGVEVITTMQPPLFFIPIVGVNSLQVKGDAGAQGTPDVPGGPGYGLFAIRPGLNSPNGKVIDWSGGNWTVSGTIHTNSDLNMSGTGNHINGSVEDVSGVSPAGLSGKATDQNG